MVDDRGPEGAHDDAREAIRRSQRIARQLHQLLAASITVSGLRSEEQILTRLAASVRSVFDAELAVITLDAGTATSLQVAVRRGGPPSTAPLTGADVPPALASDARRGPVHVAPWLVAPLFVGRGQARGAISVRRDADAAFSDDDAEVLTLLAQTASSSLAATELDRAIIASEERWRVLVETAPVGIVETDRTGAVRWWNRAAGSLFDWEVVEDAVLPGDVRAQLQGAWAAVAAGGDVVSQELAGVEIGDARRDLTVSVALLKAGSGDTSGLLTLVDDVTDKRRLMEELRHAQRMEVIGQLSSSVAHDFNNLLTLIAGYSELLSQEVGDNDRARQLVQDIQATTTRASTLTGKLLTMGRIKTPSPVVFSPSAAVGSIAEVLDRVVGVGVDVALELDADAGNVRADPDQFEQMVLNLSVNARDAMPGGGRLSIAIAHASVGAEQAESLGLPAGDYVGIVVADTGEGMDEATLARCFEPLFTTKGPGKGTGLGLPAAKRVVTESGGAIRCHSAPGEGTTFEILLPAVDEPVDAHEEAPAPQPARETGTVLLAEDEEGIRRLVARVLAHAGFDVLEADSAEAALALVRDGSVHVDLLVSDVVMGAMSGRELAEALQGDDPDLQVVLVSGNVEKSVLDELVPGSAAFLAKPFRPSALVEVVRELRSRRRPAAPVDAGP